MFDYDVVIIGAGPAGLTAGLYLSRANRRTIVLDKDTPGGPIKNWEWIENYPGFADGVSGASLASEMVAQATKYGVQLKQAEVMGIELFTSCKWVQCADGSGYTATVVIIAGGCRRKKLGVSGEERLQGKGVFDCALCDASKFADGVVAVCGGGDSGITEALYIAQLGSKVILIEAMPTLNASAVLQDRVFASSKIQIRCGAKVEAITGGNKVTGIEILNSETGQTETLEVDGVLVNVGLEPNSNYLTGIVPVDSNGRIHVNNRMETEIPCVLAAGDIRSDSPGQIATAVGDGATAAISAERFLEELR